MTAMASLISSVGSVVTASVTWMAAFVGAITAEGNEILLIGFLLAIAGFGVGLFQRLVRI